MKISVKRGISACIDPIAAVAEIKASIDQPNAEVVVFFCGPHYDLTQLGACLKESFSCPVIGCTTAGEVTSEGLSQDGIVAASVASSELKVHCELIHPLAEFGPEQAKGLAERLRCQLTLVAPDDVGKTFGFLLVDGLSMLEEQVLSALYWQMNGASIVGGSAGDSLEFRETWIYFDGQFHTNAAVFSLFETTLPFQVFKTQHFAPTGERLVITASDPSTRTVHQINGRSAAAAYAKCLGLSTAELSPAVYAQHPIMLRVGDEYYVRSISRINDDGSLNFFAAIEDGLVLNMANCEDIISNLRQQLRKLEEQVPSIQLILGCDCILRRLEVVDKNLQEELRSTLESYNFLGFSTYGEQFNGVHVNQTMTGVAIGA